MRPGERPVDEDYSLTGKGPLPMIEKSSAPGSKPSHSHSGKAGPRGNSFFNSLLRHLDPMWATIRPQLFEHIDGLKSVCPKPRQAATPAETGEELA